MADTTLSPTGLVQIEVGASAGTWGTKENADKATINAWFDAGPALKVANGGTGATTASGARTSLGLAIGTNVQAYDANLTGIGAAWTAYTPTLAAFSGALGTHSASGRYKLVGKTLYLSIQASITNNGTGATYLTFTLPPGLTAQSGAGGVGIDISFTRPLLVYTASGETALYLRRYDGIYPVASGSNLLFSITMEVQ